MRRPWLAAVLALVVLLGVTAGVGWDRYSRLRPLPVGVATRTEPLTEHGVRYRVLELQRLQRITFADHDPLIAPEGATWVRLEASLELTDAATSMEELRCTAILVSGDSEWADDYDPASYANQIAERQCHTVGDGRPLAPGVPKTLILHWLVPSWAAETPRFFLRFSTPPRSLELLP